MLILSPAQRAAFDEALHLRETSPIVGLVVRRGNGRTTVLRALAESLRAPLVTLAEIFRGVDERHPLQVEEAVVRVVLAALSEHEAVVIDDLHVLTGALLECCSPARPSLLPAALAAIVRGRHRAEQERLVVVTNHRAPSPLAERAQLEEAQAFTAAHHGLASQAARGR